MVTQDRLIELFIYDEHEGSLIWRSSGAGVNKDLKAGCVCKKDGYIRIRVDGVLYLAHRLIWLYVNGEFPKKHIDHINRIKTDNRIVNLREATDSENAQNCKISKNNKSGYTGVSWHKGKNKWRATIQGNGRWVFLGYYVEKEHAYEAYKLAKSNLHTFNPEP